jgi:hypothetical protein
METYGKEGSLQSAVKQSNSSSAKIIDEQIYGHNLHMQVEPPSSSLNHSSNGNQQLVQ